MTSGSRDPVARFFGSLLVAIGALMMLFCGGCGVIFLGVFLITGISQPDALAMALIPLVVGGVPAAIGFGLYKAGTSLRPSRSAREQIVGHFTEGEPGSPPNVPDA